MTESHIIVARPPKHPGVMTIRFNRPQKKNAITIEMYRLMSQALGEAEADDAIRVVAFLGTDGCFSAGNDLAEFLAHSQKADAAAGRPAAFDFLLRLAGVKKTMVSGVDGLAIGIGTTLNLHCDLTIASTRSLFRTPFVDLALVPEAGSSLLAPRVMGHQRAFALLALGESFSADTAREAGLVWRVVEPAEVERETLALAERLAAKPAGALVASRLLLRMDNDSVAPRIEEELKHFRAQLATSEARTAFEAFMRR